MHKGHLTLVGAGPGDIELISLKGINAIKKADVILFDALIHPGLLEYNKKAEKIFVGKRRGNTSTPQIEINALIIHHVLQDKDVVRLKGGDPMVFARSVEELNVVKELGISSTVVPGISSFLGAAASLQIPLTQREKHESFWVITGHTSTSNFSKDLYLAAQSTATIVILMGIKFLKEIIQTFRQYKPGDYPIAVIQNATTTSEKYLLSDLSNVVDEVRSKELKNPAVIIIGNIAKDKLDHSIIKSRTEYA